MDPRIKGRSLGPCLGRRVGPAWVCASVHAWVLVSILESVLGSLFPSLSPRLEGPRFLPPCPVNNRTPLNQISFLNPMWPHEVALEGVLYGGPAKGLYRGPH